jgi:hypothetical protein
MEIHAKASEGISMKIKLMVASLICTVISLQAPRSNAQTGPGYVWSDIYTVTSAAPALKTCESIAGRSLGAEHWVNVHALQGITASIGLEAGRGDMGARIICLLSTLPPDHKEGFTAVIVTWGPATGVPPSGAALYRRFVSLSPKPTYNY